MRRIETLGGEDRVRFCEVLNHAFPGTLSAARERSRVALGAADKHRPFRVKVLNLEVHFGSFVRVVGTYSTRLRG